MSPSAPPIFQNAILLAPLGAAAAKNPDAELIRLCAAFDALEREFHALFIPPPRTRADEIAIELRIDRIFAAQRPLLKRLLKLRATTLAGFIARFRTLRLHDAGLNPAEMAGSPMTNDRLLGAFLRDFGEVCGVPSEPIHQPRRKSA